MSDATKTCTKCGETKPLSEYSSNGRGGLYSRCKPCVARLAAAWREKNLDRAREATRRRYREAKARYDTSPSPSDQTKVCTKCGGTKALERFGSAPRGLLGRSSVCKPCTAAARREYYARTRDERVAAARRRKEKNPEAQRAWAKTTRQRHSDKAATNARMKRDRHQAVTASIASNHGKEWTGPELELAADYSRSAVDVARALGRTYSAVVTMRRLLRTDPRKARMAGTDVEPTS